MKGEKRIRINVDVDIMAARQASRALGAELGFSNLDMTFVATAISELARNILQYAGHGVVVISPIEQGTRKGIQVIIQDEGPGIPDLDQALQDGYSTSNGLGLGLPGSRRLMDEFQIISTVGKGTKITMSKWKSEHLKDEE